MPPGNIDLSGHNTFNVLLWVFFTFHLFRNWSAPLNIQTQSSHERPCAVETEKPRWTWTRLNCDGFKIEPIREHVKSRHISRQLPIDAPRVIGCT